MKHHFNIKSHKKTKLIDLLLRSPDKRRRHSLLIASCYFEPVAAKLLINSLMAHINISDITIYIDRKDACRIGKDKLTLLCNSYDNLNIYAVHTNCLFHTKGYAIYSSDVNRTVICGSLVIGSANLTGNGITCKTGNIECLLDTQDNNLISQFINQLSNLKLVCIEDLDYYKTSDDFNFKYALLQEGAFIHKWSDNLKQLLAVRYYLNDNGKSMIGDKMLDRAGFKIETASISKQYFNFDYEPTHLEGTENLKRNYGIETYLGHWIPNTALDTLFEQDAFYEFKEHLQNAINIQAEEIKHNISKDFEYLKSLDIIQTTESDPADLFVFKTMDLMDNDSKLRRIFSKYEIFYLPYDITQKEDLEYLYDKMIVLANSRKKKNITMNAFFEAISETSLNIFKNRINQSFY